MTSERVLQVVPDLASFAVDDGFAYRAGDHHVELGSLVRIPLSGRPRRGFVVDVRDDDPAGLKEIRGVSGDFPVFHADLLGALTEAAEYYVAPRSVLLGKAGPPNLPRRRERRELPSIPPVDNPVGDLVRKQPREVLVLAGGEWARIIRGVATDVLMRGRSVVAVLPTAAEVARLGQILRRDLGARVVAVDTDEAAAVTAAWVDAATTPGVLVLGTARVVWWPVEALSLVVLVDEGRRGMKERQTPTVSVRHAAAMRARREGFSVVHLGRVPTSETVAASPEIVRIPGRLWPPVEVVDRGEEPPGGGLLTDRARIAVRQAIAEGRRVMLFTHRHGYAPAARCIDCRRLRVCGSCGARPDPGSECVRCGAPLGPCSRCGGRRFEPLGAGEDRVVEEAARVFGRDVVGRVGTAPPIQVGTERDLVTVGPVDLAVAVDGDGLVRGTNYRASEDALAIFARLAGRVRRGRRNRLMIQTAAPDHDVYSALRHADPVGFLRGELEHRDAFGMPPRGEVMVIEVSGIDDVDTEIRDAAAGGVVFGPAAVRGSQRWLIQGAELTAARRRLRDTVAHIRDRGGRVRIDVDPRDL